MSPQGPKAVPSYGVELLFDAVPALVPEVIGAIIDEIFPGAKIVEVPRPGALALGFPRKGSAAKLIIARAEGPVDPTVYTAALAQTFDWPEAEAVVNRARSSLLVADWDNSGEVPKERLPRIRGVAEALIGLLAPTAVVWRPSGCVVSPESQVEAFEDPTYGAINVRLFRYPQSEREVVLDTLGLSALGLPDLQVRCSQDPRPVVDWLYKVGRYVFDEGRADVFRDGETIDGPEGEGRYTVELRASAAGPKRTVAHLTGNRMIQ